MEEAQFRNVWASLMPYANREISRVREGNRRFVHYTSAESGMKILSSGRVILRNSILMNDFSEVEHGMMCLNAAYESDAGVRLKAVMAGVQEDLPAILQQSFNGEFFDVKTETYLTSISEHGDPVEGDDHEDRFGRLSMWRAYGNRNGIAFVFNNRPFVAETTALPAVTSPVLYATPQQFLTLFEEVTCNAEKHLEALKTLGGKFLHDTLMTAFRFSVQSTKHPSFKEEREWRILHTPTIPLYADDQVDVRSARMPSEIMTLGGVPQRIFSLPFQNYPEDGFDGATIPELIDRVLIGPSENAYAIAQAFVQALTERGLTDAQDRVIVTGVPLRQ